MHRTAQKGQQLVYDIVGWKCWFQLWAKSTRVEGNPPDISAMDMVRSLISSM
jgi:hypothetical protein